MSAIPEDIRARAETHAFNHIDPSVPDYEVMVGIIALFGLAERERCAKIAENAPCQTVGDHRRADAIATAIRTPPKQGPTE